MEKTKTDFDARMAALFDTTPQPGYLPKPCPSFDLLQGKKANEVQQ